MANSIKQTKVLFEGFRRFVIKEAEAEKTPESGEIVRIFDFDNTLFSFKEAVEEAVGSTNFYLPYLKDEVFIRVTKKIAANSVPIASLLGILKQDEKNNFKNTYIVSLVGSGGYNKPKQYFIDLLLKKDKALTAFLNRILRVDESNLQQISDNIDESKADEYVTKYLNFAEDEEPSNEKREALKTQIIASILKDKGKVSNFPSDHIKVRTKIAESTTGATAGIIKGTASKMPAAEQIAAEHPNASGFEVYDNSTTNLAKLKDGIVKQRMPAKEGEKQATSNPAIDRELNIKSFKVDETGAATESSGELRGSSRQGTKDPIKEYLEARQAVFKLLANRSVAFRNKENNAKFVAAMQSVITDPTILGSFKATLKDLREFASSDQKASVGSLDSFEFVKDPNTQIGIIPPPQGVTDPEKAAVKLREVDPNKASFYVTQSSEVKRAAKKILDLLDDEKSEYYIPKSFKRTASSEPVTQQALSAAAPSQSQKSSEPSSTESIYEELDRLLSNKKYSFNITTKK